jgi:DNA-directed RNA polymerase subunit RPC12/RpoP
MVEYKTMIKKCGSCGKEFQNLEYIYCPLCSCLLMYYEKDWTVTSYVNTSGNPIKEQVVDY